jgi:hypothetical protein
MMTVTQTPSRYSAPPFGWLVLVELMMARWRTQRAARRARSCAALPEGDLLPGAPPVDRLTPEARAEADLRAAYRLWFGGDPLGRL